MERAIFVEKCREIKETNTAISEIQVRNRIRNHADMNKDISICIGELAELSLELTRYQRGKMNGEDFLQELSHVQWAIWTLQEHFDVSDEDLLTAVQASFR